MNKLFGSLIFLLVRSKSIYILAFIMFLLALLTCANNYESSSLLTSFIVDDQLFAFPFYIGILLPIFDSCFLANFIDSGMTKEAIMHGYKREHIYISILFLNIIVSFIFGLAYIFGDLLFGFYVKGVFSLTAMELTKWFLLSILVLISYSSLYTFIYFVTHNGIAGSGISISSSFIALVLFLFIDYRLNSLSDVRVYFYQFLNLFLPTNQSLLNNHYVHFASFPIVYFYQFIFIFLVTILGIYFFKKKEIA